MGSIATLDALLVAACSRKFLEGAWFPLVVGVVVFLFMATWSRGSDLLLASIKAETPALRPFIAWLAADSAGRPHRRLRRRGRGHGAPLPALQPKAQPRAGAWAREGIQIYRCPPRSDLYVPHRVAADPRIERFQVTLMPQ